MKRILITLFVILSATSLASARQPQKGYRGFLDWSNSYRTTASFPGFPRISSFYTGFSTVHGYQINPMFFAGAGLDFEHCSKIDSSILAIFADGRADFSFNRLTPYADVRLGYNCSEGGGVYFSPSVGYRFNWGRKVGINLGLGLTIAGYSSDILDINYQHESGYLTWNKVGTHHGCNASFSFRLGFDF